MIIEKKYAEILGIPIEANEVLIIAMNKAEINTKKDPITIDRDQCEHLIEELVNIIQSIHLRLEDENIKIIIETLAIICMATWTIWDWYETTDEEKIVFDKNMPMSDEEFLHRATINATMQ